MYVLPHLITKLYGSCVRPILEYCSAILKEKKYVECNTVFNRAIRYFLGLSRTALVMGMHGDMGWVTPKYNLWLN